MPGSSWRKEDAGEMNGRTIPTKQGDWLGIGSEGVRTGEYCLILRSISNYEFSRCKWGGLPLSAPCPHESLVPSRA